MTHRRSVTNPRWFTIALAIVFVVLALWQQRGNPPAGQAPAPRLEPLPPAAPERDTSAAEATSPQTEPGTTFSLREIGRETFESPAGLVYRSGGPEGHRIDHVLQHARDIPSKPVHGVFEGDRNEILKLIDEAYGIALKRGPPQVTTQQDGDRTIYTVDLKRIIGHLGGESGARRKHPALQHVRLVLEGRNVITAYPLRP